jgi:4-amino-4-deoxy-L-arabinose transferase-like glycosyltransferase
MEEGTDFEDGRLITMLRGIAPVILVFLLIVLLTEPAYLSDTARYINEIQNHRAHLVGASRDPFWDFGHPAWRPLVNAMYDVAGGAVQNMRGGDGRQALAWLMIAMNMLATLAAVLLLWSLLRRHSNSLAAGIASAAFLCTNAVLDYSRSGSSYIPALACLVLALWLIQLAHARQRSGEAAILPAALAGLSLGASVLFWFPFVLSLPAAVLYAVYGKAPAPLSRVKLAGIAVVSCGLTVAVAYAAVTQERQIHTFAGFKEWVASSSNDWSQTDKVKRAVSGIPRSFLDLGDDTLLLKRYVLHDPYTPIGIGRVVLASGTIKLLLFYLYAGAVVWVLWNRPGGRGILLLLVAGAVPVLLFAITLFEPGSTERYLPAYPFFFLAAACALAAEGRTHRTLHWCMIVFLIGVLCAGNFYAKADWRGAAAYRAFLARKNALEAQAQPDSMIAVINFWDPLYRYPALRLLDSQAQPRNLWVYDVIEVANTRVFHWRQEFAAHVQARWSQGRQVWVSKRLLADKPLTEWKWVEGDTGRVHWSELREFFRSLDFASGAGGADGFVLMAHDQRNVERIRELYTNPNSKVSDQDIPASRPSPGATLN